MRAGLRLDIHPDGAIFNHGDSHESFLDEFDATLERRESGELSEARFIAALKDLIKRRPDFIDAQTHLGLALMAQGKYKPALDAHERALAIGEAAIPDGYAGRIEWGWLENRPFLRAAHGVVLCQLALGRRREAVELIERMLIWNPEDNQGLRFIVGSQYLRLGDLEKARRIFEEQAEEYPPYWYELALARIMSRDWVGAATALRRGFVENIYIGELLSGAMCLEPLVFWHGSNLAEPEIADDYLQRLGDQWAQVENALAFARWLYHHPKAMAERAAILECRENLLWEAEIDKRRAIIAHASALIERIDDDMSRPITAERKDARGRMSAPWLYWREPTPRRRGRKGAK